MAATSAVGKSNALRNQTLDFMVKNWSYIFLLLMIVVFSVTGRGFLTLANFSNVLVTSTMVALMAIGQTYVVITLVLT